MKLKIKNSQHGYAHPVLLVVLLVGVVGVVAFSGYQAVNRNKKEPLQSTAIGQGQIVIAATRESNAVPGPDTEQTTQVSVKSTGSAAAKTAPTASSSSPATTSQTGTISVSRQYEVTSPIGSLSQLITELQKGNYSNALYFVTPEFVSKAYGSIGAQDLEQFINNCQSNEACRMLASTKVNFDLSHVTQNTCTPPSGAGYIECKKVGTKFVYENNELKTVYYKTVGYNVHEASVTMLRAEDSTSWVINGVNVDNFAL